MTTMASHAGGRDVKRSLRGVPLPAMRSSERLEV
jgi:hypothetical protein